MFSRELVQMATNNTAGGSKRKQTLAIIGDKTIKRFKSNDGKRKADEEEFQEKLRNFYNKYDHFSSFFTELIVVTEGLKPESSLFFALHSSISATKCVFDECMDAVSKKFCSEAEVLNDDSDTVELSNVMLESSPQSIKVDPPINEFLPQAVSHKKKPGPLCKRPGKSLTSTPKDNVVPETPGPLCKRPDKKLRSTHKDNVVPGNHIAEISPVKSISESQHAETSPEKSISESQLAEISPVKSISESMHIVDKAPKTAALTTKNLQIFNEITKDDLPSISCGQRINVNQVSSSASSHSIFVLSNPIKGEPFVVISGKSPQIKLTRIDGNRYSGSSSNSVVPHNDTTHGQEETASYIKHISWDSNCVSLESEVHNELKLPCSSNKTRKEKSDSNHPQNISTNSKNTTVPDDKLLFSKPENPGKVKGIPVSVQKFDGSHVKKSTSGGYNIEVCAIKKSRGNETYQSDSSTVAEKSAQSNIGDKRTEVGNKSSPLKMKEVSSGEIVNLKNTPGSSFKEIPKIGPSSTNFNTIETRRTAVKTGLVGSNNTSADTQELVSCGSSSVEKNPRRKSFVDMVLLEDDNDLTVISNFDSPTKRNSTAISFTLGKTPGKKEKDDVKETEGEKAKKDEELSGKQKKEKKSQNQSDTLKLSEEKPNGEDPTSPLGLSSETSRFSDKSKTKINLSSSKRSRSKSKDNSPSSKQIKMFEDAKENKCSEQLKGKSIESTSKLDSNYQTCAEICPENVTICSSEKVTSSVRNVSTPLLWHPHENSLNKIQNEGKTSSVCLEEDTMLLSQRLLKLSKNIYENDKKDKNADLSSMTCLSSQSTVTSTEIKNKKKTKESTDALSVPKLFALEPIKTSNMKDTVSKVEKGPPLVGSKEVKQKKESTSESKKQKKSVGSLKTVTPDNHSEKSWEVGTTSPNNLSIILVKKSTKVDPTMAEFSHLKVDEVVSNVCFQDTSHQAANNKMVEGKTNKKKMTALKTGEPIKSCEAKPIDSESNIAKINSPAENKAVVNRNAVKLAVPKQIGNNDKKRRKSAVGTSEEREKMCDVKSSESASNEVNSKKLVVKKNEKIKITAAEIGSINQVAGMELNDCKKDEHNEVETALVVSNQVEKCPEEPKKVVSKVKKRSSQAPNKTDNKEETKPVDSKMDDVCEFPKANVADDSKKTAASKTTKRGRGRLSLKNRVTDEEFKIIEEHMWDVIESVVKNLQAENSQIDLSGNQNECIEPVTATIEVAASTESKLPKIGSNVKDAEKQKPKLNRSNFVQSSPSKPTRTGAPLKNAERESGSEKTEGDGWQSKPGNNLEEKDDILQLQYDLQLSTTSSSTIPSSPNKSSSSSSSCSSSSSSSSSSLNTSNEETNAIQGESKSDNHPKPSVSAESGSTQKAASSRLEFEEALSNIKYVPRPRSKSLGLSRKVFDVSSQRPQENKVQPLSKDAGVKLPKIESKSSKSKEICRSQSPKRSFERFEQERKAILPNVSACKDTKITFRRKSISAPEKSVVKQKEKPKILERETANNRAGYDRRPKKTFDSAISSADSNVRIDPSKKQNKMLSLRNRMQSFNRENTEFIRDADIGNSQVTGQKVVSGSISTRRGSSHDKSKQTSPGSDPEDDTILLTASPLVSDEERMDDDDEFTNSGSTGWNNRQDLLHNSVPKKLAKPLSHDSRSNQDAKKCGASIADLEGGETSPIGRPLQRSILPAHAPIEDPSSSALASPAPSAMMLHYGAHPSSTALSLPASSSMMPYHGASVVSTRSKSVAEPRSDIQQLRQENISISMDKNHNNTAVVLAKERERDPMKSASTLKSRRQSSCQDPPEEEFNDQSLRRHSRRGRSQSMQPDDTGLSHENWCPPYDEVLPGFPLPGFDRQQQIRSNTDRFLNIDSNRLAMVEYRLREQAQGIRHLQDCRISLEHCEGVEIGSFPVSMLPIQTQQPNLIQPMFDPIIELKALQKQEELSKQIEIIGQLLCYRKYDEALSDKVLRGICSFISKHSFKPHVYVNEIVLSVLNPANDNPLVSRGALMQPLWIVTSNLIVKQYEARNFEEAHELFQILTKKFDLDILNRKLQLHDDKYSPTRFALLLIEVLARGGSANPVFEIMRKLKFHSFNPDDWEWHKVPSDVEVHKNTCKFIFKNLLEKKNNQLAVDSMLKHTMLLMLKNRKNPECIHEINLSMDILFGKAFQFNMLEACYKLCKVLPDSIIAQLDNNICRGLVVAAVTSNDLEYAVSLVSLAVENVAYPYMKYVSKDLVIPLPLYVTDKELYPYLEFCFKKRIVTIMNHKDRDLLRNPEEASLVIKVDVHKRVRSKFSLPFLKPDECSNNEARIKALKDRVIQVLKNSFNIDAVSNESAVSVDYQSFLNYIELDV